MKDKRTTEGGDILNYENFVTRSMQEQERVVCHEAASSTRWLLGGCGASGIESLTSGTGKKKSRMKHQSKLSHRKKRGYVSGIM